MQKTGLTFFSLPLNRTVHARLDFFLLLQLFKESVLVTDNDSMGTKFTRLLHESNFGTYM